MGATAKKDNGGYRRPQGGWLVGWDRGWIEMMHFPQASHTANKSEGPVSSLGPNGGSFPARA